MDAIFECIASLISALASTQFAKFAMVRHPCVSTLCSVLVDFVLGDEEGAEGGVHREMEGCDKSTAEKV